MAELAINNAWSAAIQSTPFFLNYGQHPRVPGASPIQLHVPECPADAKSFVARCTAAIESAKAALKRAHEVMRARFKGTPRHYEVGQQVLITSKHFAARPGVSSKLLAKWAGPYTVAGTIDRHGHSVAVQLQLPKPYAFHPTVMHFLHKHHQPIRSWSLIFQHFNTICCMNSMMHPELVTPECVALCICWHATTGGLACCRMFIST